MKKYIVLFIILIFSTILLSGCKNKDDKQSDELAKIKKKGYITVGVKGDSIPFGYYINGNLTGLDIEIARKIASNIFNDNSFERVHFVIVNAQNRISMLNSGKIDIIVATMSVNEKRKLVVDFSTPYFTTSQKIMVRIGSKITNLNYFNNKGKLAIILGTTGEKIAHIVAPNANVIGAKNYTQAAQMLSNYKVDAILGDDCILKGIKESNFKIINRAYSKEFYAVAVRKSENSKELLNVINSTIIQLLDKKEINLIKSHYGI